MQLSKSTSLMFWLFENNQGSVDEDIENKEQWEVPKFQDTASSGKEIEAKVFTYYRMEEEDGRENNQGSVAEGIENKEQWEGPEFQDTASGGQEIEAKVFTFYRMEEEEYKEKNRENLVKRELLVSIKGEFYSVKFIINPEEDDVEPSVIRPTKGIADFGNKM
ncbi:hypothetical protein Tco_0594970 [Tanacetum coccineum]